jgi:phosphoglycerol transferase MdoB-like AlkP superfamily enzyme
MQLLIANFILVIFSFSLVFGFYAAFKKQKLALLAFIIYLLFLLIYFKKLCLPSLRFKHFFVKICILSINVLAQCALNSLKALLRFAYCALGVQTAFCVCGATFLTLRAHPCLAV